MNWNSDAERDDRRAVPDGGTPKHGSGYESGDGSHHPGPPRFVTVDDGIVNPNGREMETRDDLAPWNPEAGATYDWRVLESPDGSTAEPTDDSVAEFEPDVPGVYTLALEAPDGTHELTVRVFPAEDESNPRPRISLDATISDDRIELSATATVAGTDRADDDLEVEYYVDDRDDAEIAPNGTISIEDVTESVRVYAVAVGDRHSVPDAIELVPTADEDGSDAGVNEPVRVEHPFEPPAWVVDSIVYEIFTRRFPDQDEPTFETIADRLDHLEALGIDILWLTPFLEAESGFGTPTEAGGPHGYNTRDYFAVDDDLGTMADLEALVDACHEREIRVVFDLVINHTADTHPFYEGAVDESNPDHERYRDWYRWEDFDAREADTYFGWDGIPNLDHGNPAVREYLLEVVDFWADRVDGIRADVAWGVPLSFWTEIHDRLTAADSEFFLLDETLPSDVEMGGGRFHMHHDDVLHDTLEAIGESVAISDEREGRDADDAGSDDGGEEDKGEDEADAVADEFTDSGVDADGAAAILDAIEERERRGAHPDSLWLLYVENHDTDRYLARYGRDAQLAAAASTFTLPGSPMCYYGQETGVAGRREPMNWGAFDADVLEYYRQLLDLRRTEPALQTSAHLERIPYDADSDAAVAFARTDSESGRRVVVALHFGAGETTVQLDEPIDGPDLLTGESVLEADAGEDWNHAIPVDSAIVLEATSSDDDSQSP